MLQQSLKVFSKKFHDRIPRDYGHENALQRPILPNHQALAEYNLLLISVEALRNCLRNKYIFPIMLWNKKFITEMI